MNEEMNELFETDIERFARSFLEDTIGSIDSEMSYRKIDDADGFRMKFVKQEGGEGDGADMWLIMSCTRLSDNAIKYVRFSGMYSSWDASEMDPDPEEVHPKKVIRDEWLSDHEIQSLKDFIVV